jgi:hypothetical protein
MVFGEAERGAYCMPFSCSSLEQLIDYCGNPPEGSAGISYGVQTLMYKRGLIYFRVEDEGFSTPDYMQGFRWLQKRELLTPLIAICLPGVGDSAILDAAIPACSIYQSSVVLSEKDLYDYLTSK